MWLPNKGGDMIKEKVPVQLSKEDTILQIEKILRHIKTKNRYMSYSTISKDTNTHSGLVELAVSNLVKIPYVDIIYTPTQKIKNFKLNYYKQGIVCVEPYCVTVDGYIVEGSNRRYYGHDFRASDLQRYKLKYQDLALNKGYKYIYCMLELKDVAKDLFIKIFEEDKQEENAIKEIEIIKLEQDKETGSVDIFEDFPFCKMAYDVQECELKRKEAFLKQLIETDEAAKKNYDTEYRKAVNGQRNKQEAYSINTGKKEWVYLRTVRSSSSMYGDEVDHQYEEFPVYETRYKTVTDYPRKPVYHEKDIEALEEDVKKSKIKLNDIKSSLHHYEDFYSKQSKKKYLEEQHEKDKRKLESEYKDKLKNL